MCRATPSQTLFFLFLFALRDKLVLVVHDGPEKFARSGVCLPGMLGMLVREMRELLPDIGVASLEEVRGHDPELQRVEHRVVDGELEQFDEPGADPLDGDVRPVCFLIRPRNDLARAEHPDLAGNHREGETDAEKE